MSEILEKTDSEIIEFAFTITDWSEINLLCKQASEKGKSKPLIDILEKRETYIWYHYEKEF